ncbi:1-hydroxycarotenoid 3,4-desaturase CrtD [Fulvivirga sedimenti]|uniref:Phytoene desaturase n=1 Tax=Fulvivirga sedimenti TaxID=2879465 RepID=A0A9X1HPX3_9BACT|nr:1-hydroxycarotenoid 3,4-desaturase CrtD [Fulvivirga sedimenti]MCA6074798.1 phytoene desaturase [Fulvivirga sedimenti]MCA6075975.1 phytoene desaturase [Fulvivirga sedimenti]MCA6077103.1 phytoene desaturase [Fulvivirga sedimenti]
MSKNAIIIGSGIAGIASALRLRKKGYDVTVFEANPYVGGKLHVVEKDGFRWDAGPSLFTMPHLVDELFELHDIDPRTLFNYKRKEVVCNYFWEDGTTFSVHADTNKFISEAARTFNTSEVSLKNYLRNAKEKYDLTTSVFLEKSLHKASTYLSFDTLKSLIQSHKLDITSTLNSTNKKYFSDPRLVQLFNRYATYNGSSPYQTPGVMSLIPHLEMHYGCFLPKGGMHAITKSLHQLAIDQKVQFRLNEPVKKILHESGVANGVQTEQGSYYSDLLVCNMDIYSTYNLLLKDLKRSDKILRQERSSSALIYYWGVGRTFKELDLHNIFFSKDYREEFRCLFKEKTFSEDPTVYINITSKDETDDAPEGNENWFVMINAPANYGQDWETLKKISRDRIVQKINRILKTDIEKYLVTEEILDPILIESRTSSHRGSLYGASSNSKFSAFLRHPNFSGRLKNLYFCGGSVHPGGGIPLCLQSAKIVSDLIPDA